MIDIKNVSKSYGNIKSLEGINSKIDESTIYGLIGSNGSGKSTLLRIMSGILASDEGEVTYNEKNVYENPLVKSSIVYLSDEQYFIPNSNLDEMASFYSSVYRTFSKLKYSELIKLFELDGTRKISTFSKGMKKQASVLLGLACYPKYLLCDETFDGLDPVMRKLVMRIFVKEVAENGMTPIIASHNLREIEDICDHIGLLHRGRLLFESDLDALKSEIHTVQAVFDNGVDIGNVFEGLHIISEKKRGSLTTLVVKGDEDRIKKILSEKASKYVEVISLTLEEIFISEMEERGYDYSKVVF